MAKKKTTTVPKVYTLSKEQLQTLKDIAHDIMNIRSTLEDLEGEDEISKILFRVGMMYNVANRAETVIDELVDSYDEDYDYDSEEDNY